MIKDNTVTYLTPDVTVNRYWNIPIANTTCLILGTGTSITNAAVRYLSKAGVLIGFSGSGGTPFFSGCDVQWYYPQDEYRPTEYMQRWCKFWFDENKRLDAAKKLQHKRIAVLSEIYPKNGVPLEPFDELINDTTLNIEKCTNTQELLALEGRYIKKIYSLFSAKYNLTFKRDHDSIDNINIFLNHGNYLAYGISACALWTMGLSHSFPLLHGKTRRGGLVFDLADIVKDSIILPQAFISNSIKHNEKEFRSTCLNQFIDLKIMDIIFDFIKNISEEFGT